MAKKILFIHGRSYKPKQEDWEKLWKDAVTFGIKRDRPQALEPFRTARKEYIYYGDLSNAFLEKAKNETRPDDIQDRRESLKRLQAYKSHQFNKAHYKKLPNVNPWYDHLADTAGATLNWLHLGQYAIEGYAPDMKHYWSDAKYGSQVRWRLTEALYRAHKQNHEVMIVAHSLGTIIAYDVLWKFSRYGEFRYDKATATDIDPIKGGTPKPVSAFVTLGCPLGDETVKRNLKGASNQGDWKYPSNIQAWHNVAAEDDFICHDDYLKNDFKEMYQLGLIDKAKFTQPRGKVYNLAVRSDHGSGTLRSNPHNGVGYLLHPTVTHYLADWLES